MWLSCSWGAWLNWRDRRAWLVLMLVLLAISGCHMTTLRIWGPGATSSDSYPVQCIKDVVYCDDQPDVGFRHQLDLFVPEGKQDYPVVVLVHGGVWMMGDNRCCGLYSA